MIWTVAKNRSLTSNLSKTSMYPQIDLICTSRFSNNLWLIRGSYHGIQISKFIFEHFWCLLPLSNRVRGGSGRSIPRQDSTKTQFSFSFVFCVLLELLGFDCWDWLSFSPFDWLSADRLSVWGLFSLTKAWITSFTDVLKVKFWTSFSSLPIYIETEPN